MNKSKRVLPALTGLRFLLGFWVIAYHQSSAIDGLFQPDTSIHRGFHSLLHTGYSAVSVFFILSGFVLSYNYDLNTLGLKSKLKRFAIARFSRIYPAYLAGIAILLPLAAYRMIQGMEIDATGGLLSFILNLTLLQAWLPETALTWNYPGWSLSNEAFFYALLPFIGASIYRLGKNTTTSSFPTRRFLAAALGLWACSIAFPLFVVLAPVHGFGDLNAVTQDLQGGMWSGFVRYDPLLRLPEFCMGILLARVYRVIPEEHWLRNHGQWLYLPATIITMGVLMNGYRIPYPLIHNGLLAPLYAIAILGLALEGGMLVRILSAPWLIFLGNVSYSMYILHAPLYAWLKIFFERLFLLPADGVFWFSCYLIVVTVASCLFYWLVEEHSHRWLRQRLTAWADR